LIGLAALRKQCPVRPFQRTRRLTIGLGLEERDRELWSAFSGAPSGRVAGVEGSWG